jgi:cell wall-associated NlpC family hydrolase
MFAASIFINLAFINPNNSTTLDSRNENSVFSDCLAEIEDFETEAKASQIEIESKDLTGIKKLVAERRRRDQTAAQREAARTEKKQQVEVRSQVAAVARPRVSATYAPNTYVFTEESNDQHGNSSSYSKNFVPMDKDLDVFPVKYTLDNGKYSESEIRNTIIEKAKKHIGTHYVWGGKKPGGFDCSGFTSYMLSLYGVHVSPSSRHQGLQGAHVNIKDAQTGDLVFFSRYGKGGRISHVAMVVENTGSELFVIHACSRGIIIDNILNDKYWTPKILFARNVINPKGGKTKVELAAKSDVKTEVKAAPVATPAPEAAKNDKI